MATLSSAFTVLAREGNGGDAKGVSPKLVPEEKAFNMTMARGKSLAAYMAEARKCVLVCANSHGEIETGMIESPPAGTGFVEPQPSG